MNIFKRVDTIKTCVDVFGFSRKISGLHLLYCACNLEKQILKRIWIFGCNLIIQSRFLQRMCASLFSQFGSIYTKENFKQLTETEHFLMHLSISSPRGGGGGREGSGIGREFGIFLKKNNKISFPRQKVIVKSISKKWITSFLLFVIERSNDQNLYLGDTCPNQIQMGFPEPPSPSPSPLTLIGTLSQNRALWVLGAF